MSKVTQNSSKKNNRPALSPENRENQLIAAAVNLAEKQLMDGTASSQVITHYLKLATVREKREREKLEKEIELLDAKKKAYESSERLEALFTEATNAMKRYSGNSDA